jgi:hypothetical protein
VTAQPDFSTRPRPRRPARREIALVGLGVAACAFAAWSAWTARSEAEAARARLAEARRELGSMQARLRGLGGHSTGATEVLRRAAAAQASPPDRVVAALARHLPPRARLERLTISYADDVSLDMQVVSRDPAEWDLFLARLEEDGAFADVTPGPERREAPMRTSLHARWGGGRW